MKLFIYIPTYNRPLAVRAQLTALVPQVIKHKDCVRLLVNDNASPGGVNDDLSEQFRAENAKFTSNGDNIGVNGNIALGFVFARPDEFLWILSDNDIVTDNAVELLLPYLKDDIDFVSIDGEVKEEKRMRYNWEDGWVLPVSRGIGLISGCVHNMRSVSNCVSTAFYFHNSALPHVAVVFAAAKKKHYLNFQVLPARNFISQVNYLADVSVSCQHLSLLGVPLLAELMPYDKGKEFAYQWLKYYRITFYRCGKGEFNFVYKQTLALFKSYGIKFKVLLFLLPLYSFLLLMKDKLYFIMKMLGLIKKKG